MVEWNGLENRRGGNSTKGSNPFLSAIYLRELHDMHDMDIIINGLLNIIPKIHKGDQWSIKILKFILSFLFITAIVVIIIMSVWMILVNY